MHILSRLLLFLVASAFWEKGSNRIVTPPSGSYYSDPTAHPCF